MCERKIDPADFYAPPAHPSRRGCARRLDAKSFAMSGMSGEPGGNRTPNPQIKSLLLCQLSYRPYELLIVIQIARRALPGGLRTRLYASLTAADPLMSALMSLASTGFTRW